jgi:hypothetical protein
VGCGICLGSCAFDAIGGLGADPISAVDVTGSVALVCARQARVGRMPGFDSVIEVRCTGMIAPRAIGALSDRGASSIQVIGCPPGDCAYGIGNLITSERFAGARPPSVPRRWRESFTQDWVNPIDARRVLSHPGAHPNADLESSPGGRWVMVPAVLVVLASVVAIRFATDAPFRSDPPDPVVRVVVDHVPGSSLTGQTEAASGPMSIRVMADSLRVAAVPLARDDRVLEVVDVPLPAGTDRVEVEFSEGSVTTVLFSDEVDLAPGRRIVVEAVDRPPPPGVFAGKELFEGARLGASLGCDVCHSVRPGVNKVGPSLAGIGDAAADRVPGLSAEEYLRQSILDPDAYIVDGYSSGQMLPVYGERLDDREIEALVAYLLSLKGDGS